MKPFGNPPEAFFDSPVATYPWPARAVVTLVKAVAYAFSKLYWRWTCDGPDPYFPTPEGGRGRVFIANHASMLDPVVLVVRAMGTGCTLRPVYKGEFESNRLVNWFFARLGALPVKRGTADMRVIKRAINCLKRGENLLIFPEGTRIWDPDARPEVYGGFSLIAQMAGADVVPIAIDGTERINPFKRHLVPRPARVRVRFGEALSFDAVEGEDRRAKAQAMEKLAMEAVYGMRAELRSEIVEP